MTYCTFDVLLTWLGYGFTGKRNHPIDTYYYYYYYRCGSGRGQLSCQPSLSCLLTYVMLARLERRLLGGSDQDLRV